MARRTGLTIPIILGVGMLTLVATPAWASAGGEGADPSARVVLALAAILMAAKLGGDVAVRLRQPAVLGELLAGILLGNLGALGFHRFEFARTDPFVDMFSRVGVLILLFEVGLESTVPQMMKVGASSLRVAVLGAVAPFAAGWGVGAWLLPEQSVYMHAFLGAALSATSVGISARVLKDLGRSNSPEARIILGAAVIDDVLGLVILAAVSGVIAAVDRGETMSWTGIGLILGKALFFLTGALWLGMLLAPRMFALAARLRSAGVLLAVGLAFCFTFAWFASVIGLAPIVGAFAAGLLLERSYFQPFADRGERELEDLVHPVASFLVPIIFVVMGMRVELLDVFHGDVLVLAAVLSVAAILGKQVCAAGVVGKGVDRITVGLGMIPRGEVGLIFANVGLTLTIAGKRVVDPSVFSAVVLMVLVTTMVTPPLLAWRLRR